jgi:hypothetical protein
MLGRMRVSGYGIRGCTSSEGRDGVRRTSLESWCSMTATSVGGPQLIRDSESENSSW